MSELTEYERATIVLLERGVSALERISTILGARQAHLEIFGEDHKPEHDPDFMAALAAEVEGRIQGGSTPNVARDVDVQEVTDESPDEFGDKINLLEQPRDSLADLKERIVGEDPLVKAAEESGNPVAIAALEIVYTNLSPELWGSDMAAKHISRLMSMHYEVKIGG